MFCATGTFTGPLPLSKVYVQMPAADYHGRPLWQGCLLIAEDNQAEISFQIDYLVSKKNKDLEKNDVPSCAIIIFIIFIIISQTKGNADFVFFLSP